jgi:hypothetical protein
MSIVDPFGKPPPHPLDGANMGVAMLDNARRATGHLFTADREADTFEEELRKRGLHLIPAAIFDHDMYRAIRNEGNTIAGVLYRNHALVPVELPRASTAISDKPSRACLRALAGAVLHLYGTAPATELLKQVVAYALLATSPRNPDGIFDEYLLTSLRRWVRAIAIEEENLLSRSYIPSLITSVELQLTGLPLDDMKNQDLGQNTEIPHIAGVLAWVLTPPEKRETAAYPTRSLRAFHCAIILSQFGFGISLGADVHAHIADYKRIVSTLQLPQPPPDVFLTVESSGEVDPLAIDTRSEQEKHPSLEGVRPRVVGMGLVPGEVFRHLTGAPFALKTGELVRAWIFAFSNAYNGSIQFSRLNGDVDFRLCLRSRDTLPLSTFQISLWAIFFDKVIFPYTSLLEVCSAAFKEYIPASPTDETWNPDVLKACLDGNSLGIFDPALLHRAAPNAYLLLAIVLGSIYGICSTALVLPANYVTVFGIEVAFYPDIARPARFTKIQRWVEILTDLCAGTKRESIDSWRYLLMDVFIARSTSGGTPAIGARQNGVTLISDFAICPSLRAESHFRVHVVRGLPLNLPSYNNDGIIRSSGECAPSYEHDINAKSLSHLPVPDSFRGGSVLRLDLVPHWKNEDHPVVLEARIQDTMLTKFGLWNFQHILPRFEPCECGERTTQLQIPTADDRWRHITIENLLRIAPEGLGLAEDRHNKGSRYFVNAIHSESTTLFALGLLQAIPEVQIVWDCFDCAVKRLRLGEKCGIANHALVLPFGFPISRGDICLSKSRLIENA